MGRRGGAGGQRGVAEHIFHVPAISCQHCVRTIVRELSSVPGVQAVRADLASKQVVVVFQGEDALDRVRARLREVGYPPAE